MEPQIQQRFIDVMSSFFGKLFYGIEKLEIKSVKVGNSIILMNYIANNQPCSMTDVANYLGVIPSTATRRIDKLVAKDLVTRTTTEPDLRTVYLELSKLGAEIHDIFFTDRTIGVAKFSRHVDPEDLRTFLRVVERFMTMMDEDPEFTRLSL